MPTCYNQFSLKKPDLILIYNNNRRSNPAPRKNKMKLTQNQIEKLSDMIQCRKITADQANVEKVKMARVQLVTIKIPAPVRKALNNAVMSGELGHVKKNGRKPEAYYHPTFEYLVAGKRNRHERATLESLKKVCC